MSQRPLRDELRDTFDGMTRPADPALAARIRDRIGDRPAPGGVPRFAMAIAVVVAVAVIVGLVAAGRLAQLPRPAPAAPAPTTAPTAAPPTPGSSESSSPLPAPSGPAPSTAPGAVLPGFSCAAQTGGGGGSTTVTDVRAGAQNGYDRFVIQFGGAVPRYELRPQGSATFTQDASGRQVTLRGSSGLLVIVRGASSGGTYKGSTDLQPGLSTLQEARQTGDFEGVVQWGLGLSHPACFRALVLTGPGRLVIDVQH
jgi:hypothetical protein